MLELPGDRALEQDRVAIRAASSGFAVFTATSRASEVLAGEQHVPHAAFTDDAAHLEIWLARGVLRAVTGERVAQDHGQRGQRLGGKRAGSERVSAAALVELGQPNGRATVAGWD